MGAIVIPPILDLLNRAYGFPGTAGQSATAAQPLPAPQATLISALAKGVIQGQIDWSLIGIGVIAGIAVIALDETLRVAGKLRLPPLAVGIGIYLPVSTIAPVVVGAVIGWYYDRWAKRGANTELVKRLGVLLASGLIVGESLFGVLLAAIIVFSNNGSPLAVVGDAFQTAASALGGVAFVIVIAALYRWIGTTGRRISALSR
jgi:putative OPT family oligopeptide transporter